MLHRPAVIVRRVFIATLATALPVACRSPLGESSANITDVQKQAELGDRFDAAIKDASERQVAKTPTAASAPVGKSETDVDRMLSARRDELNGIGPQSAALGNTVSGIVPLSTETPARVMLSLQSAIEAAVKNNLDVQTARLSQSINQADLDRADAAFDWVVGAGAGFRRVDQPSVGILFPGSGGTTTVIPSVTNQRNWNFGASIGKATTSGGQFQVSAESTRLDNLIDGVYTPDPAWSTAVNLGFTQPLLRGFGSDVALSQVRLAQNNDRLAIEELRARLLDVVAQTQQAYWQLVSARARLVSAEWLVTVGEEVRDVLAKRREFDATVAQYANAVATVESRKALVLEARRRLSEAGNSLKAVINSPDLPVGGEVDVVTSDAPSQADFTANLRQSLETAFAKSPRIQQALIGIDSASIGVTVADNGRLPQLDLATSATWFGLKSSWTDTTSDIAEGDYVNYAAALQFSQALGNRAAEASYLEARLRRSQAVVVYDRAVQGTVLAVKNALVDCVSFRQLVEQNRTFRLAQAENLRALLVDEKTLAALTPEFLQLKFQLQNGLAQAEDQYFASLVGYQSALAALQQATGTGLEANRIEFNPPMPSKSLDITMP